MKVENAKILL